MRQLNDSDFVEMLNRIRLGVTTQKDRDLLWTRLITLNSDSNESRLLEITEYLSKLPDDTVCILPIKNMCQQLNSAMLKSLPNTEIKLKAVDTINCPRYLSKRARECIKKYEDDASMTVGLEENIIIKIGAKVMLRRNIDIKLIPSYVLDGVGEVPGAWQPGASGAIQDASPRFMDNIFVLSVV
ncbi:unnamed protein product, partial [Brenthis ino]